MEDGTFADALGAGIDLQPHTLNSGTEAIEALFSGAIDAAFVGPNPAINGFAQSGGEALRIVAGTTSGGAALVVRDGIDAPDDLIGTTLATPALGNTQDVALRSWLAGQGIDATTEGGGDVSVRPQENADTLTAFVDGAIDGAWVPEPWATRLVLEGGGHVLVDEATLWEGGRFVTTQLVVAASYLEDHPALVRALIAGLLDSIDTVNADPAAAQAAVNDGIEAITGKRLADATLAGAWAKLTFTPDPVPGSLEGSKEHAVAIDLLEPVDLSAIYDLTLLNQELSDRGQPPGGGARGPAGGRGAANPPRPQPVIRPGRRPSACGSRARRAG
ncbi:MAG: ABC transporter substrate-binding protein [Acidimicrobiia bacterium]|nr:ABC transporter substrate-binding protein [Acidimicrobiia bacterium]